MLSLQSCGILTPQTTLQMAAPAPVGQAKLRMGTTVVLLPSQQTTIGDIKQGTRLAFHVAEQVQVDNETVISANAMSTVEVIRIQRNGSSKSDAVTLRVHSVAMVDGRIIPLQSQEIVLSVNILDRQARLLPANFRLSAYVAEDVELH
ncbi:MAG: hypothetical protein U5L45_00860 [Saprospiraceae bacterium]|nr:hypothetical protein [Saprospiraceae bacterium]